MDWYGNRPIVNASIPKKIIAMGQLDNINIKYTLSIEIFIINAIEITTFSQVWNSMNTWISMNNLELQRIRVINQFKPTKPI